MRRLALFALTLAVAAPAVSAQGFLDRARRAVQNATSRTQDAAQEAVPQRSAAVEGQPAPASDYASLLEVRFFSETGGFYIDGSDATALFVRDGATGKYVLRNADGIALAEVPITGTESTRAPVIQRLDMRGAFPNERIAPLADGIYWLNLEMGGDVLGSVPFEVAEHGSDDPFDPKPTYLRDGPWRTLGYLDQSMRDGNNAHFTAYIAPSNVASEDELIAIGVYKGGRQVACSSPSRPDFNNRDWTALRVRLYSGSDCSRADTRGTLRFETLSDGPYQIRVTGERSGTFRTFTLETEDGAPKPHPRSALDYEPRHDYLTPRRVWRQTGWREHELVWLSADR